MTNEIGQKRFVVEITDEKGLVHIKEMETLHQAETYVKYYTSNYPESTWCIKGVQVLRSSDYVRMTPEEVEKFGIAFKSAGV